MLTVLNKEKWSGLFEEDVIQNKEKKLGVVLKTVKNGEDSDDSENSSDDEHEKMKEGKIMVAWYNPHSKWSDDEIKVVDENSIELVDRSLLPGDAVRWVSKVNGSQKGLVKSVDVKVDVVIVGTNHILKDIPVARLPPLDENISCGTPIIKGSWLGIIRGQSIDLTVRLKNGSKCVISGESINELHDVTDQRDEDSTFYNNYFYPGQQIQGIARVYKEAKWILGTKPAIKNQGKVKAIVEQVDLTKLMIDWQLLGYTGSQQDTNLPYNEHLTKEEVMSKDFSVLKNYRDNNIQIGDKAYYILTQADVDQCLTNITKVTKKSKVNEKGASKVVISDDDDEEDDSDVEVEPVIETNSLLPAPSSSRRGVIRPRRKRNVVLQKHKKRYHPLVSFVPGEKICVEICKTKTKASVLWQDGSFSENILSTELYPVMNLDDSEFFPGDFVVDKRANSLPDKFGVVQTTDNTARVCTILWFYGHGLNDKQELENEVSVYDIADHRDYTYRAGDVVLRLASEDNSNENENSIVSPAGQVIQVNNDGTVMVRWIDDSISSVKSTHLIVVDHEEDDNWDTEVDNSVYSLDGDEEEWETDSDASETMFEAVYDNINPLEDVIMRSLASLNTAGSSNNTQVESVDSVIGLNQRTADYLNKLSQQFARENIDSVNSTASTESSIKVVSEDSQKSDVGFIQNNQIPLNQINNGFTSVECVPSCHHFFNNILVPANPRTFNAAVIKEVKMIKAHLPSGIVVKTFDDRMDLFSVLIYGPSGTPYEGGIFYFDMQLPENYPNVPPLVHYHSYCTERLNPNLYEEGKVCVSLLGTWSGKGSETWTSKSSLRQLLLSIQGLILCEEPYFNEAGYEKQRGTEEGKENSRMYNEMAVIKNMQSIQRLTVRPPEIFLDEVTSYFQEHLPRIIQKFENWLSNSDFQSSFPIFPLSKGFCATLSRILEQLRGNYSSSKTVVS